MVQALVARGTGTATGLVRSDIEREPRLLRVPEGWSLPELPAAPRLPTRLRAHGTDAPSLHFDWASETARHVGTVVHRELQRLTKAAAATVTDHDAAEWLRRYVVELAELGVPADRREAAAQRVLDAVRRTLADDRGRWLLHGTHRDAQSELGLTGRWGDEVVNIVIDRTFVDAATGTRWIVDYKTSAHEGAGLDEFLDNERMRYQPQLERYAALLRSWGEEPIRLGLYFPLLSAWREWEPGQA